MPWRRTDAVKERTKFVLERERLFEKNRGMVNVSELCRAYGISRPTGYTWLKRFREAGRDVRVLENRSRRPLSNPNAMTLPIEATLVAARKLHPRWEPRKLRAWLQDRFPDHTFPSPSTIGEALKRHGLVDDDAVCYPFTISDAFSRFLIRCEIVEDPDGDAVRSVLDSAFREFGLPTAIRSDHGPPFASTGAGGLTHEALELKPPATRYTPSSRTYPRKLLTPDNLGEGCRVEKSGLVRWRSERIFISHALYGEVVHVFPCDDGSYEVSFGAIVLGSFTPDRPELRLAKRQRVLSLRTRNG
jgi:transposase